MKKLYLDMNVYNRPFDDQFQIRIRLEAMAINALLKIMNPIDFIRLEVK